MRRPLVSVLIANRDKRPWLEATLASVAAQTERRFEVVIVDDASTDGSAEWLRARRGPGLRVSFFRTHRGPAAARNAALALARGRFVAFQDSDDLWDPGYLEALLPAASAPGAVGACSDMRTIDAEGRVLRRAFYRRNAKVRDERFGRLSGLPFCPALTTCVLRRSAFTALGGLDEGFRRIHDDRDFLYRLAHRYGRGSLRFVPRDLATHRRHGGQLTDWVERGVRYLPKGDLKGWESLGPRERDIVLDTAYFSAKQDCRHCDRLRRAGATRRAGRSRTPAPAP